MSDSAHIMPSSYYRLVMREWGATAGMLDQLRSGNPANQSSQIDIPSQLAQIAYLNAHLAPGWGLRLGALMDPPAHGPVGVAIQSAPTLTDSIGVIARFGHLRTPFLKYVTWRTPNALRISFQFAEAIDQSVIEPILDASLVGIQNLLRPVIGGSFSETKFELAKPRPDYANLYNSYLHGHVAYNCKETAIALPAYWLEQDSPLSDLPLHRDSIDGLTTLARGMELGDPIANLTAQLIAANATTDLRAEDIAKSLHISKRTLVRRLGRAGTSFSALADDHRRARAHAMLCDPTRSIASIAEELGYADLANFGRACRRWYGESPGQYRQRYFTEPT